MKGSVAGFCRGMRFSSPLQALVISTLVPLLSSGQLTAAEGGYSNYVLGTYGDFGMAMAPTETWTLRNDVYSYGADMDESVRSGNVDLGADLDFLINFTTVLYKSELELFGGQYAKGVLIPLVDADIEVSHRGIRWPAIVRARLRR